MNNKVLLAILDGWGIGDGSKSDAIANANTPFYDSVSKELPHNTLVTFGEAVGLPEGQMGNSEVGHLNIGAGRIVYQDLVRINKAVASGELKENKVLNEALEKALKPGVKLHFMGLVSDGGVHSQQTHLHHLINLSIAAGVKDVFIHVFTDGRDTDPKSGEGFVSQLQNHINSGPAKIATVSGRYYAMDRDKRWERIKLAYDAMVHGEGVKANDALEAIADSYQAGITDEFIKPVVIQEGSSPVAKIEPDDVVICFNFRTDRCREITEVLTQQNFEELGMKTLPLSYYTMTKYDARFKNVGVLFENQNLSLTLGEVISKSGRTQLRVAETEKYPHVTFFFNGGQEVPFPGEDRIMISSPKVPTYDLKPEMSSEEVTNSLMDAMKEKQPDFICLNFANPDMVGHTGVYPAVIKAVEAVDYSMSKIFGLARELGYSVIIIADHGNADFVINPDGTPNTAHTMNPVPLIIASDQVKSVNHGNLADIAPTVLKLMGLDQPEVMTGTPLF